MSRVASPLTVHMYLHTYIDHEVLVHKTSFSTFALQVLFLPSYYIPSFVCSLLQPWSQAPPSSLCMTFGLAENGRGEPRSSGKEAEYYVMCRWIARAWKVDAACYATV